MEKTNQTDLLFEEMICISLSQAMMIPEEKQKSAAWGSGFSKKAQPWSDGGIFGDEEIFPRETWSISAGGISFTTGIRTIQIWVQAVPELNRTTCLRLPGTKKWHRLCSFCIPALSDEYNPGIYPDLCQQIVFHQYFLREKQNQKNSVRTRFWLLSVSSDPALTDVIFRHTLSNIKPAVTWKIPVRSIFR